MKGSSVMKKSQQVAVIIMAAVTFLCSFVFFAFKAGYVSASFSISPEAALRASAALLFILAAVCSNESGASHRHCFPFACGAVAVFTAAELYAMCLTVLNTPTAFDYSSTAFIYCTGNIVIFTLAAAVILCVTSLLAFKGKAPRRLLPVLSAVLIALFLVLYFIPVLFNGQLLNVSVVLYYVFTYAIFAFFGLHFKAEKAE